MNYGFVKVAAAVPQVKVADCFYNIQQIEGLMRQASQKEVQIIAFPELSVTSYTCMDLFSQETLLRNAEKALLDLVNNTADLDLLTIVGCPLVSGSQLIHQLLLPVLVIDIVHRRTPFLKWLYTDLDLAALCRFHHIRQDRRIFCLQNLGIGSCSGFGHEINEQLV